MVEKSFPGSDGTSRRKKLSDIPQAKRGIHWLVRQCIIFRPWQQRWIPASPPSCLINISYTLL
ncbi:hypothetical protein AFE_1859 [Acidithiobacillus ferrooxidans ATCC 23270]|uniref:Uncharacterized protein n=1 Tax=Acidithiobacillus ferrooxidans (strain ATCC 23270 / DSM 14882 / CIP 104768 / NCIMB 8455) TaxID=243159 RepID=B7JBW2_ACIF2|nr:hypothetical protein AFE_1859 [Acidithiobacillus ferrooxidans ATCC 23270]